MCKSRLPGWSGDFNSAKRVAVQFIPIGLDHPDPINHGYGLNK